MTTRGWTFSLSGSVAAVSRPSCRRTWRTPAARSRAVQSSESCSAVAPGVRGGSCPRSSGLTDGVEAAPAVQPRRHLGARILTTLQASADAVGELDRTVSVDSRFTGCTSTVPPRPGRTAIRGRRRRGSRGGRPIRYDRTAYRRRNVIERLQPARVLARHRRPLRRARHRLPRRGRPRLDPDLTTASGDAPQVLEREERRRGAAVTEGGPYPRMGELPPGIRGSARCRLFRSLAILFSGTTRETHSRAWDEGEIDVRRGLGRGLQRRLGQ